eukprot:Blabericola_migrator_1__4751@NODE_24_length_21460_cov_93_666994_g21_i0_p2_GENE_NODE_24_length_21460_cov_93_666994_g21_i0NODE_24_length_21460_cov_93_666994_g21_i0_p2_ORF_typecomplete_len1438_score186_17_NODE_24_length_21460_cov_93_666994_g21_i01034416
MRDIGTAHHDVMQPADKQPTPPHPPGDTSSVGSQPHSKVQELREHFAHLAAHQKQSTSSVKRKPSLGCSARSPKAPSYCTKLRTVRISDVESLMTSAIDFLITQGQALGFYNQDDLMKYPESGFKRKYFFVKLFQREVGLNDWNPTELLAAHYDLKQLNFSQLLFIWRLAASSGRTVKSSGEGCNKEHAAFRDSVQQIVFDRLLLEFLSPKRKQPPGPPPAPPSKSPRQPASDDSSALWLQNPTERRCLGRELLIVLGLIRRIITSPAIACRAASAPGGGLWWRVFVQRPPPGHCLNLKQSSPDIGGPPTPTHSQDPPSRRRLPEYPAESRDASSTPRRTEDGVWVFERKASKVEAKVRQKLARPPSRNVEEIDTPPVNYLQKARCALKPVHRPPAGLPSPQMRPHQEACLSPKISEMKIRTAMAGVSRPGGNAWRRGISQLPTSTTIQEPATVPGLEIFLHFPSLRISTHRPAGVHIYTYVQQAGVASLTSPATIQQSLTWEIVQFSPDAPTLSSPNVTEAMTACISELCEVLRRWKPKADTASEADTESLNEFQQIRQRLVRHNSETNHRRRDSVEAKRCSEDERKDYVSLNEGRCTPSNFEGESQEDGVDLQRPCLPTSRARLSYSQQSDLGTNTDTDTVGTVEIDDTPRGPTVSRRNALPGGLLTSMFRSNGARMCCDSVEDGASQETCDTSTRYKEDRSSLHVRIETAVDEATPTSYVPPQETASNKLNPLVLPTDLNSMESSTTANTLPSETLQSEARDSDAKQSNTADTEAVATFPRSKQEGDDEGSSDETDRRSFQRVADKSSDPPEGEIRLPITSQERSDTTPKGSIQDFGSSVKSASTGPKSEQSPRGSRLSLDSIGSTKRAPSKSVDQLYDRPSGTLRPRRSASPPRLHLPWRRETSRAPIYIPSPAPSHSRSPAVGPLEATAYTPPRQKTWRLARQEEPAPNANATNDQFSQSVFTDNVIVPLASALQECGASRDGDPDHVSDDDSSANFTAAVPSESSSSSTVGEPPVPLTVTVSEASSLPRPLPSDAPSEEPRDRWHTLGPSRQRYVLTVPGIRSRGASGAAWTMIREHELQDTEDEDEDTAVLLKSRNVESEVHTEEETPVMEMEVYLPTAESRARATVPQPIRGRHANVVRRDTRQFDTSPRRGISPGRRSPERLSTDRLPRRPVSPIRRSRLQQDTPRPLPRVGMTGRSTVSERAASRSPSPSGGSRRGLILDTSFVRPLSTGSPPPPVCRPASRSTHPQNGSKTGPQRSRPREVWWARPQPVFQTRFWNKPPECQCLNCSSSPSDATSVASMPLVEEASVTEPDTSPLKGQRRSCQSNAGAQQQFSPCQYDLRRTSYVKHLETQVATRFKDLLEPRDWECARSNSDTLDLLRPIVGDMIRRPTGRRKHDDASTRPEPTPASILKKSREQMLTPLVNRRV